MTRPRWSRTSIAAALAIAAGGCMAVSTEPLDGDAQTGGQAEAGYPAVGAILADGQPRCTGTLIATGAVLTAAHCVKEAAAFTFGAGAASAAAPGSAYVVTRIISHPLFATDPDSGAHLFDLAVLLLGQQAAEEPLAFNREDAIGLTGQNAVLVGYGLNAQPGETGQPVGPPAGQKLSARLPIVSVTDQFLDFAGGETSCPGDTGGPALMDVGGQSVVVGVASWGDDACSALHTTRTDVLADFVIQAVGGVVPPPPGTGPPPEGEEPPPGEGEEPPPGEPPPQEPPPQEPPPEEDFCEQNGWYDDGVCDDCPLPDPDCF